MHHPGSVLLPATGNWGKEGRAGEGVWSEAWREALQPFVRASHKVWDLGRGKESGLKEGEKQIALA